MLMISKTGQGSGLVRQRPSRPLDYRKSAKLRRLRAVARKFNRAAWSIPLLASFGHNNLYDGKEITREGSARTALSVASYLAYLWVVTCVILITLVKRGSK